MAAEQKKDESYQKTIVSYWNERNPLKHAIVYRADDCYTPPPESTVTGKAPIDSDMKGMWRRRPGVLVVNGNEIFEAAMSYFCRWFENPFYRPLIEEHYRKEPNMRWEIVEAVPPAHRESPPLCYIYPYCFIQPESGMRIEPICRRIGIIRDSYSRSKCP